MARYPGVRVEVDLNRLLTQAKAMEGPAKAAARGVGEEAIRQSAEVLGEEMLKNISLTDHTLGDLRREGHPYGRKSLGGSGLAGIFGSIVGHEPWQVHIQRQPNQGSAAGPDLLVDALMMEMGGGGDTVIATVGVDSDKARHAEYIIMGTRFMVSRDFISASFLQKMDEMFEVFEDVSGFHRLRIIHRGVQN